MARIHSEMWQLSFVAVVAIVAVVTLVNQTAMKSMEFGADAAGYVSAERIARNVPNTDFCASNPNRKEDIEVTVLSPKEGRIYKIGNPIEVRAEARDRVQNCKLPPSQIAWELRIFGNQKNREMDVRTINKEGSPAIFETNEPQWQVEGKHEIRVGYGIRDQSRTTSYWWLKKIPFKLER